MTIGKKNQKNNNLLTSTKLLRVRSRIQIEIYFASNIGLFTCSVIIKKLPKCLALLNITKIYKYVCIFVYSNSVILL